jgi:hypothetical protein
VPPLSHLTSCTPTKSNSYLAYSLTTVVRNPDLYRLLTLHVPNIIFLFHCWGRTEGSVRFRGFFQYFVTWLIFYGEELLAPCPTSKLEDHPLSAVRDCLFNIFAATLHICRPFLHPQPEDAPCRGDRDPLITVTGTHLSLWQGPTYRGLMMVYQAETCCWTDTRIKCSLCCTGVYHFCVYLSVYHGKQISSYTRPTITHRS